MNQPTIEQVKSLIDKFVNENWRDVEDGIVNYQPVAEKIHALYMPTLKLLSDLADNEEDCNKLALAIYGKPMQPPVRGFMKNGGNGDWFSIETGGKNEYGATLTVYKDGKIVQSGMHGKANIFKIVDEIRNLGYDVQPETKTTCQS